MVLAKECRWLTDRASGGPDYVATISLHVTRRRSCQDASVRMRMGVATAAMVVGGGRGVSSSRRRAVQIDQ